MLRQVLILRVCRASRGTCGLTSSAWHSTTMLRAPARSLSKDELLEKSIDRTRNIGIVAHIDAGKTTTTERMLFHAGAVSRVGEVDSGTTTTDFMKEEMDRGITIQSAAVSLSWKDHSLHLIDTPGHVDFTVEVERAMRVVDGVVALFDASAGVQAQSYTVLQQSRKFGIPVIAFINKMDKLNANFESSVQSIRDKLHVDPMLLQLPLRAEDGELEGVIDLISQRSFRFGGRNGAEVCVKSVARFPDSSSDSIPQEEPHIIEAAGKARHSFIAQLTGYDSALTEKLIHHLDATDGDEERAEAALHVDDLRRAVRRLTLDTTATRPVMPVLCGASRRDVGVQPLLDAVMHYLPSPRDQARMGYTKDGIPTALYPATSAPTVPTVALVFKVIHTTNPKGKRSPLVFLRVYSGRLLPRMVLTNHSRGRKTEVAEKLYVMQADKPVEVPHLVAGDIGAVFLTEARTGDTLIAAPPQHLLHAKPHLKLGECAQEVDTLEGIDAPPPVISFSLEAATASQLPLLEGALEELCREDPSLCVKHDNFGHLVISGMGELHLEIVMSRLEHEHHAHCRLLRAMVEYRETIRTPCKCDQLVGHINDLPFVECSMELRPQTNPDDGECATSAECRFVVEDDFREAFIAQTSASSADRRGRGADTLNAKEDLLVITSTFSAAVRDCSRLGPLAGVPMHGMEVVLHKLRKVGLNAPLQEKSMAAVSRTLVLQLLRSVQKTNLALLEPIMEVEVELSERSYVSEVVSSLNERNALSVEVIDGGRAVKAVVAMRNLTKYTMALRKVVKGHANLLTRLDHYRIMEDKAVISRVLKNLGITE